MKTSNMGCRNGRPHNECMTTKKHNVSLTTIDGKNFRLDVAIKIWSFLLVIFCTLSNLVQTREHFVSTFIMDVAILVSI